MPSVTQVLAPYSDFSRVDPDVLIRASERGTKVHAACATYALGGFPVMDGEVHGYFTSFKAWFDATVKGVAHVEMEYEHPLYGYIGHPDLVCVLRGESDWIVVDLKTPAAKSKAWRMQLAAYAHMVGAKRAASLRLKRDGSRAIFDEYEPMGEDFQAFLHALSLWKYLNA